MNSIDGKLYDGYFKDWFSGSAAFAILEPLNENIKERNVLVLGVKDKNKAAESLKEMVSPEGKAQQPLDTFLKYPIYNYHDGNSLNRLFGNSFVRFDNCFFRADK